MKAVLVLFDTLNRLYLPNYGCGDTIMPNFERLGDKCCTFDSFYAGSMPCMPARRELHTGRYNFLHTPWSPMQPFDESVIGNMGESGIYTHITTDHFHYWQDGGSGYLTKFNSFEAVRGQEGDRWKALVRPYNGKEKPAKRYDAVNRLFMNEEESMPQYKTFKDGLEFIERNHAEDNWFLQIEEFDPHEPFFTQNEWKSLYPEEYDGGVTDWPDYGENGYSKEDTEHLRNLYRALLSMCDSYLGKVLDSFDKYNLWEDTMLIVATDHGFMLGEKGWTGKNIQPVYEELSHIPFFIHDPRHPEADGKRRSSLAQTVDIAPTLSSFMKTQPLLFADGINLEKTIERDEKVREYALFGIFGGHVNITDGRYVYMRGPIEETNTPLNTYTLMPMHMIKPFTADELRSAEFSEPFSFSKGLRMLKIPSSALANPYRFGTRLYDLSSDPEEVSPIEDGETENRMKEQMIRMMKENEAPEDQFERLGL